MIKNEIKVLDDISHILLRAGMYIGSVSLENHTQFINGTFGTHTFCTGLIKLIEETYINSIDEAIRTNFKFANKISISIENDFASGWQVCIKDNGRGLPQNTVIDTKGEELPGAVAAWTIPKAGGNFDDSAGRLTAGMNGMGVSLTNIFSKRFTGITADGKNEITLQCKDNLSNFEWNIVPAKYKGTSVTFTPDFSRFESDGFSKTDIEIIKDQITTLAVIYPKIEFTFNNEKIIGNFKKYAKNYDESAIVLENDNHMIALCRSEDGFRQLSYVNSIHTKVGGTHIDFIMDELTNELIPQIKKKHKVEISKARIKECITLITFIKDMPNLRFDSQTKERLTSPFGEIKSHLNLDISKLAKAFMSNDDLLTPIIELAVARKEAADKRAAAANLKKAQKKKIANHIAANDKDPENKTIFIAEGFSAASQGTSVRDPKKHGFYALRGKVLNTHEMKSHEILANKELSELVAIIGLDFNDINLTNEDGTTNLNYGKIAVLTDADTDGNAIFCLLLMFFSRWPGLFEQGRICRVNTPLYIARKKGKPDQYFYTPEEYEKADLKGWTVDYLKGLGSLERDDYKKTVITHPYMSVVTLDDMNKLNMAFGSDTNLRKKWMID